jgi:proline iminopeptidase
LVPDGPVMRSRPPAMVIHGGPGSDHSGMRAGMERLTARAQVIYFDHRGQGRSDRGDPARYTLDENVEDMEALRKYLGLGPVISIGTSYGGMVAMAHAARHPSSVSHLILIVTAAHQGFVQEAERLIAQRGTPEQRAVCTNFGLGRLRARKKCEGTMKRWHRCIRADMIRWRRVTRRNGRSTHKRRSMRRSALPDSCGISICGLNLGALRRRR